MCLSFAASGQHTASFIITDDRATSIRQEDLQWLITEDAPRIDSISTNQLVRFSTGTYLNATQRQTFITKFNLLNTSKKHQEFVFQFPKTGRIEVMIDGHLSRKKLITGSTLPLTNRAYPSSENIIPIKLPAGVVHELTIVFAPLFSIYKPPRFDINVIDTPTYLRNDSKRFLTQGMFLGVILVMALYNFVIFFSVRDISYLHYVMSIVGIGLYFGFYYGFGIEYLWPNEAIWDTYCFAVFVPVTSLARLFFTRTYLHTPAMLPAINKLINVLAAACILTIATGIISFVARLDILIPLVDVIGLLNTVVLVVMLIAGLISYKQVKYEPAKYFIWANFLLVIGAILFILREIHLLSDNLFTRYFVQVGLLIQTVVFALGLASRLNRSRMELAQQRIEQERLALEIEREKKQMIEDQRRELQLQVKQQTLDLQNQNVRLENTIDQLMESEAKLTQLNNIKDKLFSIISHDLRNPLATMQSFLKLITTHHEKLSAIEKEKLTSEAQDSLEHLNTLLYNLLQWSKSQMNLLAFNKELIALKPLVERCIQLMKLHAHMKQVEINVTGDDVALFADKEMVEFIVRNLLSNAIKFSNAEGRVEINIQRIEKAITIAVKDNGIGMNEQERQQLLNSEFILSRRGTAKEKGAGLGLLICKEFIHKHNGSLEVYSKEAEGSTFTIAFPEMIF